MEGGRGKCGRWEGIQCQHISRLNRCTNICNSQGTNGCAHGQHVAEGGGRRKGRRRREGEGKEGGGGREKERKGEEGEGKEGGGGRRKGRGRRKERKEGQGEGGRGGRRGRREGRRYEFMTVLQLMALHCTNTYTHANAHDMHGCHDVTHTGVDHQPDDQTDQTIENTMDLVTHGRVSGYSPPQTQDQKGEEFIVWSCETAFHTDCLTF